MSNTTQNTQYYSALYGLFFKSSAIAFTLIPWRRACYTNRFYRVIQGIYRDDGQQNGNYHLGFRV